MLGAASAVTERVGLRSGVLLAALRKPAALANEVVQLDDAVLDVVPEPTIPIWVGVTVLSAAPLSTVTPGCRS
jgi:hypothetical protein